MVSSLTGTTTHLIAGDFEFDISQVLFLSIGVVVGAQVGAHVSGRLSHGFIIRLLAAGIALIGVRLIFAGISIPTPQ